MISISRKNLKIAGLIWAISLVVLVPIYMFVLNPQKEQILILKQEIPGLLNDMSEVRFLASASARESLKKEVEELQSQLGEFVVKTKDDIQTLASIEIYNIAKSLGLEDFNIDPWGGVEVSAFNDCKYVLGKTIIVSFNASFTEFAKFTNMLESYKTIVFVDSFSITRSSNEGQKHKVEMNLAVLVDKKIKTQGT